ncbi:hypothetical protein SLS62_000697 [Diatrype stigma]|uniref:Uncharacterized protein n=1 Tax=Diatrype stigma TaxID=117547 RepID=A0AAN9UX24_9PEZI
MSHHKRSIATAKEARAEKDRLKKEFPDAYRQPDPFNTNPYWSEEIMMGPHWTSKKKEKEKMSNKSKTSERGLHSAGNDKASMTAGSTAAPGTPNPASATVVAEDGTLSQTTSISEDWNKKRYQREDEELWGHEFSRAGHRMMAAIKQAGSSAHRRIEATLGMEPKPITDQDRAQFYAAPKTTYFAPKNPPVNDYHPPIVRQRPAHKDAHKWMLQPPPAAKVMEGKVPVSRTGSMASHLSRKTTTSDSPALGRKMHEKAMEAKLRNGESPSELQLTPSRSRPDSRKNADSPYRQSWQSARSNSVSMSSGSASEGRKKRKTKRKSRPVITLDSEASEDDEMFYKLKSTESNSKSTKVARRPNLKTIASSQGSEDSTGTTIMTTPGQSSNSKTPRSTAAPFDNVIDGLPASPPSAALSDKQSAIGKEDEPRWHTTPPFKPGMPL